MIRGKKVKVVLTALLSAGLLASMVACSGDKEPMPYSEYDLSEYVEVGTYKGLETKKEEIKVEDFEIKEAIDAKLAAASTTEKVKKGEAHEGDRVNIAYEGKLDGVKFEGGSTGKDGTEITLGSSGYIDGFDAGVIGMKVGETKDLNLTFPTDYHKADLAGQAVVFTVTLNYISVEKPAEYDLEFVKKQGNAKSIEEFEKNIKKEILKNKTEMADMNSKSELWNQIMDGSKVLKYPDAELERTKKENDEYYEKYAEQYGITKDEFIQQYTGMDKEAYEKYQKEFAENIVAQELVMYSIVEKEDLGLTKKEYNERLEKLKKDQGITDEKAFEKQYGKPFEEYAGKDNLRKGFQLEKVMDFIYDSAIIKY